MTTYTFKSNSGHIEKIKAPNQDYAWHYLWDEMWEQYGEQSLRFEFTLKK